MIRVAIPAFALLVGLAGCGSEGVSADESQAKPQVVATVGMLTDIVREVAGDRVAVVGLMGPGIDPHLYKPTRHDVRLLASADLVFYVGLMLEGRMGDTLDRLQRSGRTIVAVGEALPDDQIRFPSDFESHPDPHVWMDVALWRRTVPVVAAALSELDPAGAAIYQENAKRYGRKLEQLDTYIREAIATIPAGQRHLVTAHDAFGYFSRAYDIPVRSVRGISTESAAGLADVRRLVDFLVEQRVPAIFIESSISPKNLRAVVAGARAEGAEVTIGGELYSDAMGAAGTYEGTYIGMMDHNATTITRELGGDAPEGGFRAKLSSQVTR